MSPRRRTPPTTPVTAPAWSGKPPLPGAARERLLEAAERCIARDGLAGLSMAAVATEAGVTRPTVYRYFADRRALLEATLFFAGRDLANGIADRIRRLLTPAEKAVEALRFVLQEVPRNPVLGALWGATALDATSVAGITRRSAIAWSRQALKDLVLAAEWSPEEADEAIEVMLRFLLSLLAAPEPRRSELELRAFLERRLVPALRLAAPGAASARPTPPVSRKRPARR